MKTEKLLLLFFHIMYEKDVLNGHKAAYKCPRDIPLFDDTNKKELERLGSCLLYPIELYDAVISGGRNYLLKKEKCGYCRGYDNPKNFIEINGVRFCLQCQEEYILTCKCCGEKHINRGPCRCEEEI